jgi:hypothetical protein
MTDRQREPSDAIDRLVREYVEHQIAQVDCEQLTQRIRAGLNEPRSTEGNPRDRHEPPSPVGSPANIPSRVKWNQALTWTAVTTVAAVVMALAAGRMLMPHSADASSLLQSMQARHSRPIDHLYRIEFQPDPDRWDGSDKLSGPSVSEMWTRGDRFVSDCRIADLTLKLGREADGTFWVSPSSAKGIRFTNDSSRLPDDLAVLSAVNSMSFTRLVDEVLADFNLRTTSSLDETESHGDQTPRRAILAQLKPGRSHPLIVRAAMEIDPTTHLLRHLTLWILRDGQPGGTVTYEWIESGSRDDAYYRLELHLDPDAEIEIQTLTAPQERTELGRSSALGDKVGAKLNPQSHSP